MKDAPGRSLPLPLCEDMERRHYLWNKTKIFAGTWPCWYSELGLPASRTMRNMFLSFINYQSVVFCYKSPNWLQCGEGGEGEATARGCGTGWARSRGRECLKEETRQHSRDICRTGKSFYPLSQALWKPFPGLQYRWEQNRADKRGERCERGEGEMDCGQHTVTTFSPGKPRPREGHCWGFHLQRIYSEQWTAGGLQVGSLRSPSLPIDRSS